jgi:hypothetical protein
MKHVTIRECPFNGSIRKHAAKLASVLRKQIGAQVEVIDGYRGELTVLVDWEMVAQKDDGLPGIPDVVEAVRQAEPVTFR